MALFFEWGTETKIFMFDHSQVFAFDDDNEPFQENLPKVQVISSCLLDCHWLSFDEIDCRAAMVHVHQCQSFWGGLFQKSLWWTCSSIWCFINHSKRWSLKKPFNPLLRTRCNKLGKVGSFALSPSFWWYKFITDGRIMILVCHQNLTRGFIHVLRTSPPKCHYKVSMQQKSCTSTM